MRKVKVLRLLVATSCVALSATSAEASEIDPSQAASPNSMPGPLVAQQSSATAPSGASSGQAATAKVDSDTTLTDIVVTATRREESLQKVPIAVSAVTRDQLEKAGITTTSDLTQTMPGLDFSRTNLVMQPTIRGVGTQSVGVGDENSIATYIDGVYQADPNSVQINLINIARVEVLRGPQGTLFGRNATGGLVNVITDPPSHDASGDFKVSYGSFGGLEVSGYTTTGVTDQIAFDIAAYSHNDSGYYTDLTTGTKIGQQSSFLVRPRLLIEPADNLSITITGSYASINDPSAIIRSPFNGNAAARSLTVDPTVTLATQPWTTAESFPQQADLDTYEESIDTKLNLGIISLQNTASYQNTRINHFAIDQDTTPYDLGYVTNNGYGTHYLLDEFRLISNSTGALSYIAGAFYINGKGFNDELDIYSSATAAPISIHAVQTVDSIAGFGEVTWQFADNWKLVGGLRYTSESRGFTGETTGFGLVLSQVDTSATFDKLTYRGILQRELGSLGSVYASYSTGFKSGVYNAYATDPNSQAVRPELVDATEVGWKLDPLSWLRVDVSAFNYKYTDIQLSSRDPLSGLVELSNAAAARMHGGELEVTALPVKDLNVRAFWTILDAKFQRFPDAEVYRPIYQDQTAIGGSALTPIGNQTLYLDETGKRLVRAPVSTIGVSFDYIKETAHGDFGLSANVFHSAEYFWDSDNRLSQPAYTQVNSEVSWALPGSHVRFSIWGKNLTNAVIYAQLLEGVNGDDVTYQPPRTVGGAVAYKF